MPSSKLNPFALLSAPSTKARWPLLLLFSAWFPFAELLLHVPSKQGATDFSTAMVSVTERGESAREFLGEEENKKLDEAIRFVSDPQKLLRQWQVRWFINFLVLLFGLSSVLLAIWRVKGWRLALVVASASYLFVVTAFPFRRAIRLEQWQAWWILATDGGWGARAVYNGVLFPLLHVVLLSAFAACAIAVFIRPPNSPLNR